MKRFSAALLLAGCVIVVLADTAGAATPAHLWSQRFGDVSDQNTYSMTTDASGNVIVVGYFYGTVDFGGGPLASAGNRDIYVVKFNAVGVHQWSQRFGDANSQYASSVTTDAGENMIITGEFAGTANFGGGPLTTAGLLMEDGSNSRDLWGINLYPELTGEDFIEFDSMINVRPSTGNRTRGVDDPSTRERITRIVEKRIFR